MFPSSLGILSTLRLRASTVAIGVGPNLQHLFNPLAKSAGLEQGQGGACKASSSSHLETSRTQQGAELGKAEGVLPTHLLEELHQIEASLRKSSCADGRKRIKFSLSELPRPLPQHQIEDGLHTIDTHLRAGDGTIFSKWLRRTGRTPLRVQSLGQENASLQLHAATKDVERLVQLYGRNGCQARVVALRILHPETGVQLGMIRAKPQQVHMTATKAFVVQNVDFLYCPQHRGVQVNVPVRLINDDKAPGIKQGGWMQMLRRTVRFQAYGWSIPPHVDLDVGGLGLEQVVCVIAWLSDGDASSPI